jgi:hypothetical protein
MHQPKNGTTKQGIPYSTLAYGATPSPTEHEYTTLTYRLQGYERDPHSHDLIPTPKRHHLAPPEHRLYQVDAYTPVGTTVYRHADEDRNPWTLSYNDKTTASIVVAENTLPRTDTGTTPVIYAKHVALLTEGCGQTRRENFAACYKLAAITLGILLVVAILANLPGPN